MRLGLRETVRVLRLGAGRGAALLAALLLAACGGGGGGGGGSSGTAGGSTAGGNTSGGSAAAAVQALAAGWHHTCALVETSSGERQARCWGSGARGELGDGTTSDRTTPVTVKDGSAPLAGVEELSPRRATTLAPA